MTALERPEAGSKWRVVAETEALQRADTLMVDVDGRTVLLIWNDGKPVAMDDTCIHKGRSLFEGALFNGRIVCAGHQWAFDLVTGYCSARDRYQPTHAVRIAGDQVQVALRDCAESATD